MTSFARAEREALCDLFVEVGSEAPTLCGTWTTHDLAAHLVVREGRPDAALGLVFPPAGSHLKKVQRGYRSRPFADLVATVRSGPPKWSPMAIEAVDAQSNTVEYFVHHEDVRRGASSWEPRELTADQIAQLWPRAMQTLKLAVRRSPVGIVLEPTDGPAAGTTVRMKSGDRDVTLAGPSGEITLALFGRVTSGLELRGDDSDVQAFLDFPR